MPIVALAFLIIVSVVLLIIKYQDCFKFDLISFKEFSIYVIIFLALAAWLISCVLVFVLNDSYEFYQEAVIRSVPDNNTYINAIVLDGDLINVNKTFGVSFQDNQRVHILRRSPWALGVHFLTAKRDRYRLVAVPPQNNLAEKLPE